MRGSRNFRQGVGGGGPGQSDKKTYDNVYICLLSFSHQLILKKTNGQFFKFQRGSDSGGWGGGTLIFSAYVGSDPASTIHPKKISGISSTPKKYRYLKF